MAVLSPDNKLGLWMCNNLLNSELSTWERKFVINIMQLLLAKPRKAKLSARQAAWLQKIWNERSHTNGPD
jgi:hypothetical protein